MTTQVSLHLMTQMMDTEIRKIKGKLEQAYKTILSYDKKMMQTARTRCI